MEVKSHKDLKVWKESMELGIIIYAATKEFPKDELYGLTSQIRRASISIPSNIAEGAVEINLKNLFVSCILL